MFKPLFTVATLLLLAAPGACDIPAGDILSEANIGTKGTAELTARLTAATTTEKVAHYQYLTDVVKNLGAGVGLGDSCVAHHVYMTGPLGIAKDVQAATKTYKIFAVKPDNYSESVIAGLLAVAKADVYALNQIVETSTTVLSGLTELQDAEGAVAAAVAAKASKTKVTTLTDVEKTTTYKTEIDTYKAELAKYTNIATMKTDIGKVLKDHIKNAMATLAPVEEVIYALAQGNTATTGGLKTASANAAAAKTLNEDAAKLVKATSTMIEGYFAALKTIGIKDEATAETQLTTIKRQKTADAAAASHGEIEVMDATKIKAFFTAADAYQKGFVTYVKAILPTGTNDLSKLKTLTEVNSVIGQVVATADTNGGAEAKKLDVLRITYVTSVNETLVPGAIDDVVICGRKSLQAVMPGIALTSANS